MKVTIERPTNPDGSYWKVLVNGVIMALCPSQFTAEKTGQAFTFYIDHLKPYFDIVKP